MPSLRNLLGVCCAYLGTLHCRLAVFWPQGSPKGRPKRVQELHNAIPQGPLGCLLRLSGNTSLPSCRLLVPGKPKRKTQEGPRAAQQPPKSSLMPFLCPGKLQKTIRPQLSLKDSPRGNFPGTWGGTPRLNIRALWGGTPHPPNARIFGENAVFSFPGYFY